MAKITKTTAAKPAAKKPAAKPAVKKEKNPDAFLNKFGMPVIKLGLVGALTAGVIGLTNELTKDSIATNIYNQKVSAYKESGSELEGWTFNGKDKLEANYGLFGEANADFGITDLTDVSAKELPTAPAIAEVMVYCETTVGADCNADASDVKGFGFLGQTAIQTYGNLSMLVITDVDGVIMDYNNLGFLTSFSGETGMMVEALDAIVGKTIAAHDYSTEAGIAGASVPASVGAMAGVLNEMSSMHATIALDPHKAVSNIMDTMVGNSPSFNNITATNDMFTVDDVTQTNDILDVQYIVKLNDGGYLFILDYVGYNSATIIVQTDSSGANFKWSSNTRYFTSAGYDDAIESAARSWLNGLTDITTVTSSGLGSSTTDTAVSMDALATAMAAAWGGKA